MRGFDPVLAAFNPRRIAPMRALAPWRARSFRTSRFGMFGGYSNLSVRSTAGYAPAHPRVSLNYSMAKGSEGGLVYETIRNASALAVTPTQQNEYLVGAILEGGGAGGAGAWQFVYDGVHTANLLVGASGLDATGAIGPVAEAFYPLNYGPIGTNIPAAQQTYGGGLAAVRFLLSNRPNPHGHLIPQYRSVFVTANESGTGGTSKTYSIPGPLAKPLGMSAFTSISVGTATGVPSAEIQFPAIGNYAVWTVPAALSRGLEPAQLGSSGYLVWPVPDYDPASSFGLTHKAITLAVATDIQVAGCMWY